jgi:acetylornithine deacetylase
MPVSSATALEYVKSDEIVSLASDLIRIPSLKGGDETPLARWLAGWFTDRGYEVDLQEVEPGRYQTIATLRGTGGGRSLMLNGHLDMDPLRQGWKRDPWVPTVEGDILYGAGAHNMKGADAALISAAEAVRKSGVKLRGDLVVACVLGELQGGVGTTYMLRQGLRTDMAIVGEPVGAHNLVTTHAGVLEFAISTVGFSEHISRMHRAVDALAKMLKAIDALNSVKFRYEPRADLPDLPLLNVGCIIGGRGRDYDLRGPNFTCDYCTVLIDVRFLPSQTVETVLEDVTAALDAVAREDPEFVWELIRESRESVPRYEINKVVFPPTDIPVDEEIVQLVAKYHREVTGREPDNIGPMLPASYSGDDTAHLWKAGIPCLLYGPGAPDRTSEDADDCVSISEMEIAAKVYTLTALEVCA